MISSKKRRLRQPVSGSVITIRRSLPCACSETTVGAAELVGHVLERHQLHAAGGDQIEHGADEQRLRRAGRVGRRQRDRDPGIDTRERDAARAGHGRAEHPDLAQQKQVSRPRPPASAPAISRWPGAKTGGRLEDQRCQREPQHHRHQHEDVLAAESWAGPIGVRAQHEEQRSDDTQELREAVDQPAQCRLSRMSWLASSIDRPVTRPSRGSRA